MIKVTVSTTDMNHVKGTSKTTGKTFDFHTQTVWYHTVNTDGSSNPYPEKGEVIIERDKTTLIATPYSAGDYTLHPGSLYLDRNGRLAVAPKLRPLPVKS